MKKYIKSARTSQKTYKDNPLLDLSVEERPYNYIIKLPGLILSKLQYRQMNPNFYVDPVTFEEKLHKSNDIRIICALSKLNNIININDYTDEQLRYIIANGSDVYIPVEAIDRVPDYLEIFLIKDHLSSRDSNKKESLITFIHNKLSKERIKQCKIPALLHLIGLGDSHYKYTVEDLQLFPNMISKYGKPEEYISALKQLSSIEQKCFMWYNWEIANKYVKELSFDLYIGYRISQKLPHHIMLEYDKKFPRFIRKDLHPRNSRRDNYNEFMKLEWRDVPAMLTRMYKMVYNLYIFLEISDKRFDGYKKVESDILLVYKID